MRERVGCATLPFTETSSAEGGKSYEKVLENPKKKVFSKISNTSNCFLALSFLRNRSEELFSPTYPGTYPKALDCAYKFIGEPGQRIRLEFRDFDFFYGGAQ